MGLRDASASKKLGWSKNQKWHDQECDADSSRYARIIKRPLFATCLQNLCWGIYNVDTSMQILQNFYQMLLRNSRQQSNLQKVFFYLERGKRYHSIFITVMLQMDPYLIRCLNNQFRFFILSDGSIFRWIGKRLISQVQLLESGFLQNLKTTYTCVNIVNVHCVVCTMYTVHCKYMHQDFF